MTRREITSILGVLSLMSHQSVAFPYPHCALCFYFYDLTCFVDRQKTIFLILHFCEKCRQFMTLLWEYIKEYSWMPEDIKIWLEASYFVKLFVKSTSAISGIVLRMLYIWYLVHYNEWIFRGWLCERSVFWVWSVSVLCMLVCMFLLRMVCMLVWNVFACKSWRNMFYRCIMKSEDEWNIMSRYFSTCEIDCTEF